MRLYRICEANISNERERVYRKNTMHLNRSALSEIDKNHKQLYGSALLKILQYISDNQIKKFQKISRMFHTPKQAVTQ